MTPNTKKKEEYIITEKSTGRIIHNGSDRRSVLPNQGDFKTQVTVSIIGAIITALLCTLGWCGDMAYNGIMDFEQKIYTKMSIGKANRDSQIMYIMTRCGLTCTGDFPAMLPQ